MYSRVALPASLILVFSACQLDRAEKAAPGQPTMNELMHRRADQSRQQHGKRKGEGRTGSRPYP